VTEFLDDLQTKALVVDKVYESDKFVQASAKRGIQIIIPCRVNRKKPARPGPAPLKARLLVENLFHPPCRHLL